ncbi:MAG: hypothetical protein FWG79_00595 [Bacteroidales bacterium]|nr:hypothetical protein [Bacteroidales bacterium]
MKKITLILILIASFGTQSFAYCPIPQWCPSAPLHQTLCPGESIEDIEFPSVIGKTLVITWWTDGTRIHSFEDPPPGITVSGDALNPLGDREYAWPVSIKGSPTTPGTHHYTVSNTCGVELLHGSITLAPPTPATPGTITFSPTSVCIGGAFTASVSAVSGADFYTWTTPANMTDDGSTTTSLSVTNAGTTAGSLPVSVTATNSCGTSSPSTANITVHATFAAGTIASTGQTLIAGQAFTTIGSTTNASGGGPSIEYQWLNGGTVIANSNSATFTPTTATGAGTYTRQARNTGTGACQTSWVTSSGSWIVVVIPACPGTPGDLSLCTGVNDVPTIGTVSWGGNTNIETNTRTISGNGITQQWSGAVATTTCSTRTTFTFDTIATSCRNPINGFNGHYFSFCFVIRYAAMLCPSPWRVPTCQDFANLDVALGGTGINRAGTSGTVNGVTIENQVGWYIGNAGSGDLAVNNGGIWGGTRFTARAGQDTAGLSYYWSSSQFSSTNAIILHLGDRILYPVYEHIKENGFALRCVRDVP